MVLVIALLSVFLLQNWFSSNQAPPRQFYVGIMFAYGTEVSEVEALVDKVKDYTNLFVLGSVDLSTSEESLNNACDYIANSGLNFIIQFRGLDTYNYSITDWIVEAHQKYGKPFLGIYRYDEPGGRQLDGDSATKLLNQSITDPNATYQQVADAYVGTLSYYPRRYLQFTPQMFTADYALYWYDYKANYSAVFCEFVGNESRERHIGLCRGAANAFNKDWGSIITWKYNQEPYLQSGAELYDDLALAYSAGSKYAVVFSYPQTGPYGTLTEDHFDALRHFWNTLSINPSRFGENKAEAAYVVPVDYGFGFRSATDTIWGLFPADDLSAKIYEDIETLTAQYGAKLDILYDEDEVILNNYSNVYFWNQTIG